MSVRTIATSVLHCDLALQRLICATVPKSLAHSSRCLVHSTRSLPGVTSVYHWEGKLEEDQEQLLIIKTRTVLIEELTKHVQSNHPYDECEVVTLPVTGGSSSYLSWVVATATGMQ